MADDDLVNLFFSREVEALQSLKHPNIVELFAVGRDGATGHHFLVLEWIEADLFSLLKDGPLPFDDFVDNIGLPLASALSFAHERRVVHRDVKPKNVLVSPDGTPKLADFGISKTRLPRQRAPTRPSSSSPGRTPHPSTSPRRPTAATFSPSESFCCGV